ncbi:MAG: hypothetical protein LBG80_01800 [Bacteroidales bacterium]|nr:hypothetical protein [Bacteroidales bacterium]
MNTNFFNRKKTFMPLYIRKEKIMTTFAYIYIRKEKVREPLAMICLGWNSHFQFLTFDFQLVKTILFTLAHALASMKMIFFVLDHALASMKKVFFTLAHALASMKKVFFVLDHALASMKMIFFVLAHVLASMKKVFFALAHALANMNFEPQRTQRTRRKGRSIACSDRANEVEFRPNEETCHPYGILLTDDIFSTDISSLRDFLSATTEDRRSQSVPFTVIASAAWQSLTINAFLVRDWLRRALLRTMRSIVRDYHVAALLVMTVKGRVEPRPNEDTAITSTFSKSRRDDTLLTVCFSLRSRTCKDNPNEVEPRPNKGVIERFCAFTRQHISFSIFNFQFSINKVIHN